MTSLSLSQARRIALAAQGFADARVKGRVSVRHFRRVMGRMAVLQIDSVNALCRSHFLPVFSRLGAYDCDELDEWIWRSGENIEFLAHEASITSMDLVPLLRHRMLSNQSSFGTAFRQEHPEYLEAIRAEIQDRGALSVKDLKEPGDRTGPWWGWSKGKVALEVMYRGGDLAIADRTKHFLTHYDLPNRVLSESSRAAPAVDAVEAKRSLLLIAARCHGVGTDKDLADYFRLKVTECRPLLQELVEEGQLQQVRVEGWKDRTYLHPEAARPRAMNAQAFLSPFDPVVWFRPRAERLFDFHYRIEIYVPEAKRIHGYYVLPFLLGEELVGRVDLKADRKNGHLLAKGVYLEEGQDAGEVAPAMAESLTEMASWMGLTEVHVGRRGNLASAVSGLIHRRKVS